MKANTPNLLPNCNLQKQNSLNFQVLDIEFRSVSVFVVGFPLLAFGALLCMKESPVYLERRRRLQDEAGPKVNIAKLNLEKMKFPASSPTVYIPFLLMFPPSTLLPGTFLPIQDAIMGLPYCGCHIGDAILGMPY